MINIPNLVKSAHDSNYYHDSYKKLFAFWNNTIESISKDDFENGYKYLKACGHIGIELNQISSDSKKEIEKKFFENYLNNEKQRERDNLQYDEQGNLKKQREYTVLWQKIQEDVRFTFIVTLLSLCLRK